MIAFLKVASGLFRRREFLAAFASPDLLHNGAAAYRVAVYVMLAAASETSVKSGYGSHLLFMCGRLSGLSRHFSHGLAFTVGRRVEYRYGGIARLFGREHWQAIRTAFHQRRCHDLFKKRTRAAAVEKNGLSHGRRVLQFETLPFPSRFAAHHLCK